MSKQTLGRPFKLSTHDALSNFQTWTKLAVPFKVSHIRSIRPLLVPVYGYFNKQTNTSRVVYAGGRQYSDLLVSAAKTNPEYWLQFDPKELKRQEVKVLEWRTSLQQAEWSKQPSEVLKMAYLPAYEVEFFRVAQKYSAIIGAETGRVSGLRLVSFSHSVLQFTSVLFPFMSPNAAKFLCVCLPPLGVGLLSYATFKTFVLPKICLGLSNLLPNFLFESQFLEFNPTKDHLRDEDKETYSQENAQYEEYYRQRRKMDEQEKQSSVLSHAEAYKVLNLEKRSGLQMSDYRQAYRAQLLRYHPDHFEGDPKLARQKTQQVIEAFRLLTSRQM
ncbi:hypothetical protein BASA81_004028 [Batrachochytrium salamandrivorans]|nr:hypothetical protein BASA81_004028 [Batrachochytrium salamandrivorans]